MTAGRSSREAPSRGLRAREAQFQGHLDDVRLTRDLRTDQLHDRELAELRSEHRHGGPSNGVHAADWPPGALEVGTLPDFALTALTKELVEVVAYVSAGASGAPRPTAAEMGDAVLSRLLNTARDRASVGTLKSSHTGGWATIQGSQCKAGAEPPL